MSRISSSSNSRPNLNTINCDNKSTDRYNNNILNAKNSSRYTPKSKNGYLKNESQASFTEEVKKQYNKSSSSFIAHHEGSAVNPLASNRGGNSTIGDTQMEKIDEEEEKRQIHDNPMKKRVFLHVAQTSSSVQVAWSHSTKNVTGKRIQYILEYGVGIKMNGQEQFRTIYKGKAHK